MTADTAEMSWQAEFGAWLAPFLARLGRKEQRRWAPVYLQGMLGPGERKSVEPMAARVAPGEVQQLHHFIAASPWAVAPLEEELVRAADRLVGGPGAVLVIDDTALVRQGRHSVGVARQYRGRLGERANSLMFVVNDAGRSCPIPAWIGVEEACGDCAAPEAGPLRQRSADSDARVGYRSSVCSSGAASICQRASTHVRRPHSWPRGFPTEAPPPALRNSGCRSIEETSFVPPRARD